MASEVERLKRKARWELTAYRRIADGADCGHTLLQEISVDAARLAAEFNKTMASLRSLDPACPDYRL